MRTRTFLPPMMRTAWPVRLARRLRTRPRKRAQRARNTTRRIYKGRTCAHADRADDTAMINRFPTVGRLLRLGLRALVRGGAHAVPVHPARIILVPTGKL